MRKFYKALYFSPLGRLISLAQNLLAVIHTPFMVYGYKNKSSKTFYRNTRISSTVAISCKYNVEISDYVWVWHNTVIDGYGGVKIGKGAQIGSCVGIFSHSSHMAVRLLGDNYIHTEIEDRPGYVIKETVIGEYAFIGSGCLVLPGVRVGKGSIIVPGTVVSKDVPDYTIASGNPMELGCTVEVMDRAFFNNESVKETYINQEFIRDYEEKRTKKG